MDTTKTLVSIVVGSYNEEENIARLYDRVCKVDWESIQARIELIFVDDHSTDSTPDLIKNLAIKDDRIRWMRFSRNFGSHKAYAAGLAHSSGDVCVVLAADLQSPPEAVPAMLEKCRNGAKVVWGISESRPTETFVSKIFAYLYYVLMRKFAVADLPKKGADFFLIDKIVNDELRKADEKNVSLLALIQWMGFKQDSLSYKKADRAAGKSKWNFSKKLKLAIDSFVGFSYAPLRASTILGFVFAMAGFLYTLILITRRILCGAVVEGWTSLICVVLILSGIQLLMLGIIGEYLWRNLEESRSRPRYIIEASHKINEI